jgi:serine/threonine-protein kinase
MLAAAHGHAQSAADAAAAEALFDEALKLMEAGKQAEACPKLAESQRLDPGVGTMLYLGDCYQQIGKTASAWATFREAAYAARAGGQLDREKTALELADKLKPVLSTLTIVVEPKDLQGLEVSNDGKPVRKALWGTAIPVDPGEVGVEAVAPGKQRWATRVAIPKGPASITTTVPVLKDEPVAAPPVAPPPAATEPAPSRPPPAARDPGPDPGGTQRTVGWIVGGVGLAALGAGTFFALRAKSLDSDADSECRRDDTDLCSAEGVGFAEDAGSAATIATIAFGVGIVGVGTGATLLLTAPSQAESAARPRVELTAAAAPGTARIGIRGSW